MSDRRCFLGHFVISLAVAAGAFFASIEGAPQAVIAADESRMTWVIAALFLGSALALGRQAWAVSGSSSSAYGHLAVRLSVMAGMLGTTVGLSLQAKTLMTGTAGLMPLSTSLFSTGCGILSAIFLEAMTFNLEAGIARARGATAS